MVDEYFETPALVCLFHRLCYKQNYRLLDQTPRVPAFLLRVCAKSMAAKELAIVLANFKVVDFDSLISCTNIVGEMKTCISRCARVVIIDLKWLQGDSENVTICCSQNKLY